MIIGHLPLELLKELQDTRKNNDDHEWALRKIKWALQPITNIAAAEHSLSLFEKEIHVQSICDQSGNCFKIHCHGTRVGNVEASNLTHATIEQHCLPFAIECP
jgi:hypothetical protein